MIGTQAVLMTTTFILAIPNGVGGLRPIDLSMLALACAGLVGWLVVDVAVIATISVVIADGLGVALMLPKTWRDPDTETFSTFVLATVSGVLGTIAGGAMDAALLLYPMYYTVGNALIATVIWAGRRRGPLVVACR